MLGWLSQIQNQNLGQMLSLSIIISMNLILTRWAQIKLEKFLDPKFQKKYLPKVAL